METVSVVIPVKDGARHLGQVLDAVRAQGDVELLVIDSGSRDGSLELARDRDATVHEIPPEEFGHGRTRNLAAELATGEIICFLTQDAVPADGWLAGHLEAHRLDDRVGAVYGPHLPWPDTSPMIARELEEFFATMSADGRPVLHRRGDSRFLSNVNASYKRECWKEIRFEDVAYAEDQAFGVAMLEAGWIKAYNPAAAVRHAHDYGPVEFARRYYDEYRGLHETIGHVEPARPGRSLRQIRDGVAADRRWMEERGWPTSRRGAWTARSLLHHGGRKAAAVLATRPGSVPTAVERRLSLERRTSSPLPSNPVPAPQSEASSIMGPDAGVPRGRLVEPRVGGRAYEGVLKVARDAPAPLAEAPPGVSESERLHLAFVVPPFRRGSGGHNTIFQMVMRLEDMGHLCTIWIHDATGHGPHDPPGVARHNIREWFAPVRAPVFAGFEDWHGADVAVATGWDTVHPTATLPGCLARVYLVNDHEPEFFPTSAEEIWAEETYRLGFYPISASPWLCDLLADRYDCRGSWFRLGVDHLVYRPRQIERRDDTVIFYARAVTPRRAVPLGALALEELVARRPGTRVVAFGQPNAIAVSFPYEDLGIATPGQLALNYCEATVGLCLSLTNYSLIPQEMMACGLPCVDVAGLSSEAIFGADGPAELAAPDPIALADAMEALLGDRDRWRTRSEAGISFVEDASWDTAAEQVEAGLRAALQAR